MKLPKPTPVDTSALARVAAALNCPDAEVTPLPETGIFNTAYAIGPNYVLRVPRDHPAHFAAIRTESIVVPIAVDALVRTPKLRMYDETESLIAAPFAVYDRVPGVPLERPESDATKPAAVWREVGADLAHFHQVGSRDPRAKQVGPGEELPSVEVLLRQRRDEGWFTELEVRWLADWLDRLSRVDRGHQPALIHGDVQATNVFVDALTERYLALIDWGSACWGHPACDFAAVPLRVVPQMLEGYVAAGGAIGLEASIVSRRVLLWLLTLPRGAVPGRAWAERPLALLLDMLEHFSSMRQWSEWLPRRTESS